MDLATWALAFALATGTAETNATQAPPPEQAPFTLQVALARARLLAPLVLAARERVTGAREAADRTPRWLNPLLELRTENWGSKNDVPLDSFVLLSQPLEVSGSRGARLRLSSAERVETEAAAREVEQQVVRDTARQYLESLRLRETLTFVGEQRDGLREIVTALERRVAEGVASVADLKTFEAELAQIESEALRLDLDLARSVAELGARLAVDGLRADALVLPPLPEPPPAPDEAALRQALELRPDVVMARAQLARAEAAAGLERVRGRPDLLLSGGYKRTAESNTGVIAVLLPIPLTDRNRVNAARAQAEARAAAHELDGVLALARADAFAAVTRSQALSAAAERWLATLVEPATTVRRSVRASFREGAFDALRLVDAERVWTEAKRTQLSLHLDAVLARIDARLAVGLEVLP